MKFKMVYYGKWYLYETILAAVSILYLSYPSQFTGDDETSGYILTQTKKSRGVWPGDQAGHVTQGLARSIHFG